MKTLTILFILVAACTVLPPTTCRHCPFTAPTKQYNRQRLHWWGVKSHVAFTLWRDQAVLTYLLTGVSVDRVVGIEGLILPPQDTTKSENVDSQYPCHSSQLAFCGHKVDMYMSSIFKRSNSNRYLALAHH